jgi:putative oxidoreductase
MNGTKSETRLIWPGLRGFYDTFFDIAYTLMRVAIGAILLVHGIAKVHGGVAGVAAGMTKAGLQPALAFAYAATTLETVGAACIIIGLFTRFFAAALAIEMAIALLFVHLPNGFSVGQRGYEYVLLIGIVMLTIAIRGGGPYSADRLIGREL